MFSSEVCPTCGTEVRECGSLSGTAPEAAPRGDLPSSGQVDAFCLDCRYSFLLRSNGYSDVRVVVPCARHAMASGAPVTVPAAAVAAIPGQCAAGSHDWKPYYLGQRCRRCGFFEGGAP